VYISYVKDVLCGGCTFIRRKHNGVTHIRITSRVKFTVERQENLIWIAKHNLRRLSAPVDMPPMTKVWKTLHEDSFCPYRIQQIQHTAAMVVAKWVVLCLRINAQPRLEHYIPFTDREQFTLDSMINTGNVPLWHRKHPQGIVQIDFQHSFSVSG
jgi:hypothetical protein